MEITRERLKWRGFRVGAPGVYLFLLLPFSFFSLNSIFLRRFIKQRGYQRRKTVTSGSVRNSVKRTIESEEGVTDSNDMLNHSRKMK